MKTNTPTTTPAPERADIPIDKLRPFERHPYRVRDDEDMQALIESVREHGILNPVIVRPLDGGEYEIISGHRRIHAARRAGLETVPALIYALDRDAAAVALVDSNLHREHILPSERAFAYKLKMDALSVKGKRNDLTLSQAATRTDTAAEIGGKAGESRDQVFRYLRLTKLIPEILEYVDDCRIALTPAVELSYLTEGEQKDLLETMESEGCTPSLSQAQQMKKLSQAGELDMDRIFELLTAPKANQRDNLKIPIERIREFFPKHYTPAQMESAIVKALESQRQREQLRRAERDSR